MAAGLLFRQGAPPHATYWFKHALVRDAAYGTLLREPRHALHASIAETLQDQFAEIAQSQPALIAHHFTQAGMTEAAIEWWRTAGQRSLARSAFLEGAEQLKRALAQIATLPATPDLRREEIKLHVAFANALMLTGDLVDAVPFRTAAAHSKEGVASSANARKARSCHGQLRRSSKCVSALKSTATSRPSFDGRIPAPGLGICVS